MTSYKLGEREGGWAMVGGSAIMVVFSVDGLGSTVSGTTIEICVASGWAGVGMGKSTGIDTMGALETEEGLT